MTLILNGFARRTQDSSLESISLVDKVRAAPLQPQQRRRCSPIKYPTKKQ